VRADVLTAASVTGWLCERERRPSTLHFHQLGLDEDMRGKRAPPPLLCTPGALRLERLTRLPDGRVACALESRGAGKPSRHGPDDVPRTLRGNLNPT
jgi:hypothetical protein